MPPHSERSITFNTFCNNGYANAPQHYVIHVRTLPVLFFSINTLPLTYQNFHYAQSLGIRAVVIRIPPLPPISPRRRTSSRKTIVVPGVSSRLSSAHESSRMRRTSWRFPNGLSRNISIASSVALIVALLCGSLLSVLIIFRRLNLKELLCIGIAQSV